MRLNTCILTILLFALLCGMLHAAESVYPGSKLVLDVNLTEQDFLPALKKALPGMVGIVGARITGAPEMPAALGMDYDELAKEVLATVQGLRAVSVSYYELANPNAAKLLQFYGPRVGLGDDWRPIVRAEDPQGRGSFRLYVKPDLEEIFSMVVMPKGYVIAHTQGKIDATKLAELAAKTIPAIMSSRQPVPQAEPAPGTEEMPIPEPAPEPAPAQ